MNREIFHKAISRICAEMRENRDHLIELDQQNGDGDLGLSMVSGFESVESYLAATAETDLGKLMMGAGRAFNEAAPSSLGTILSFGFMGMARALKGRDECDFAAFAEAFQQGLNNIMSRAESKPGEKTILDALCPAAREFSALSDKPREALISAEKAAVAGCEATRDMEAVHGRAARYPDKGIGLIDGGAEAGKLIIKGIAQHNG